MKIHVLRFITVMRILNCSDHELEAHKSADNHKVGFNCFFFNLFTFFSKSVRI